jgi:hypothetical protein
MTDLLGNPLLLLLLCGGGVGLALLALRFPVLLLALSVFTISLDFMGRIADSTVTYNNLTKLALFGVLMVRLLISGQRLVIPRYLLMALPFLMFVGLRSYPGATLAGGGFHFLRLIIVWFYAVAVVNIVRTRRDLHVLFLGILATALVSGVIAHFQTLNLMTLGSVESLAVFDPGTFGVRAVSTFWNPNRLALYLLNLSIFIMVGLRHPELPKWSKLPILLLLFSTLAAMLLTFSRAAMVSIGFAALMFLQFKETKRVFVAVIGFGLLSGILLIVATPYGEFLLDRLVSFSRLETDFSTQMRLQLGYIALSIWSDGLNWIWGSGYTSFSELFFEHLPPLMSHEMSHHSGTSESHVLWMTLLAETGSLGLLFFLLLLRSAFKELRRLLRTVLDPTLRLTLIGAWVLMATRMVDWFFNPNINYNEFWLTLGLIGAVGMIAAQNGGSPGREASLSD